MNNFIRARQENGSYCGPAVIQMLLSGIDLSVDQETITNTYGSKDLVMKEGIPLIGLAKVIRKLFPEVEVWQKDKTTIQELKNLVDAGYVVGFDWQGIFNSDEYGDEYWNFQSRWKEKWKQWRGIPTLKGDQGHYCIALGVDIEKGYLRFADPYGHYAGKDRYVALWEFEERWWDDRIDTDEKENKVYVLEERLVFIVTSKEDQKPGEMGMVRVSR